MEQQYLKLIREDAELLIEQAREEAMEHFDDNIITDEDGLDIIAELYDLAQIVRMMNERWWRDSSTLEPIQRNTGELLMLMVSELAEAMEGHRKGLKDTHLPQHAMLDVELVDTLIRLFDFMGQRQIEAGVNFGAIFVEKMRYNFKRADHSFALRNSPEGKKY